MFVWAETRVFLLLFVVFKTNIYPVSYLFVPVFTEITLEKLECHQDKDGLWKFWK